MAGSAQPVFHVKLPTFRFQETQNSPAGAELVEQVINSRLVPLYGGRINFLPVNQQDRVVNVILSNHIPIAILILMTTPITDAALGLDRSLEIRAFCFLGNPTEVQVNGLDYLLFVKLSQIARRIHALRFHFNVSSHQEREVVYLRNRLEFTSREIFEERASNGTPDLFSSSLLLCRDLIL